MLKLLICGDFPRNEVKFDETILRVESMEDLGVSEVSIQTNQRFTKSYIGEWEVGESV